HRIPMVHDVSMLHHHTVRSTSRAGSVNHVGQVTAREANYSRVQICALVFGNLRPLAVQTNAGCMSGRKALYECVYSQNYLGCGILQNARNPISGMSWIQWNVGASCL